MYCAVLGPSLGDNETGYFPPVGETALPLSVEDVAVPLDSAKVHLLTVLPHNVAALWSAPSPSVLREVPVRHPKPIFAVRAGQYVLLLRKLHEAGMIVFSRSAVAVNGLFGVRKPDGSLRLIVDARRANAHFVTPPSVCLASPEALTSVLQG